MSETINITGAAQIQVGTGSAGAMEILGYTRDGAIVRLQDYFLDVKTDDTGGEPRPGEEIERKRLAEQRGYAGQRQQELVQPVMDKINQVIEQIRAEGAYTLIFDVSAGGVVAADPGLDLTQEVIRRLKAAAPPATPGR